ncbi:MAG TPA: SRPBCC family protein [Gemmata sp.]|jgi:uncharacterized protein YndB with AHSA1/START domain|nr:SRPBCC family protein [Gemmata sp.]
MKGSGKLKVTTPTDREIVLTRVFDAPRHLVIEAMTKPELLQRWLLGPPGWAMIDCENDMKVGGAYRHVWRNTDGTEMCMRGVYREIALPDRIVRTESFEFGCAPQAGEQLATTILTEQAGKTTLTTTVLYPSKEARDALIASGMEYGAGLSFDRLEKVVLSM